MPRGYSYAGQKPRTEGVQSHDKPLGRSNHRGQGDLGSARRFVGWLAIGVVVEAERRRSMLTSLPMIEATPIHGFTLPPTEQPSAPTTAQTGFEAAIEKMVQGLRNQGVGKLVCSGSARHLLYDSSL